MIVGVPVAWIKAVSPKAKAVWDLIQWKDDAKIIQLNIQLLTEAERDKLAEVAGSPANKGQQGSKAVATAVATVKALAANPGGTPVKTLKELVSALTEYLRPLPHKWVFRPDGEGHLLPYYVEKIEYVPPKPSGTRGEPPSPAYVFASLAAAGTTTLKTSWHVEDLDGGKRRVPQLLERVNAVAETPEMVTEYEQQMAFYKEWGAKTGMQFRATGVGTSGSNWTSSTIAMERDGIPAKVVIDHGIEEDDDGRVRRGSREREKDTTTGKYWNPTKATADDKKGNLYGTRDDDGEAEAVVALPTHPYLNVFDLGQHEFVDVHVANLTPYVYNKALGTKLVLPADTMKLIDHLVRGASNLIEDIIAGKTGGTIVICTGPPGTGKTLTAEVFSEIMEMPLYTVQCSQLGLTPESLEQELGRVLRRASRWNAILLIDEADVYIRARGDDIQQNAIVGVWLRVLEYHRGVLFLTSNRATVIDDAVLSRATAWVRYDIPSRDDLERIWNVLLEQYKVKLAPGTTVEGLCVRWPQATGRNVKNFLKLVRQTSSDEAGNCAPDLATFEWAAKFLDVPDQLRPDTIRKKMTAPPPVA